VLQSARAIASVGAIFALSIISTALIPGQAQAQETRTSGCIGGWHSSNCVTRWTSGGDPFVRTVPPPLGRNARMRAVDRDHRWVDRCHPAVRPDRYGVGRYHYAMPGCEFGIGEY